MLHGQNVSPVRLSVCSLIVLLLFLSNFCVCAQRYSNAIHLITKHIHKSVRIAKRCSARTTGVRDSFRFVLCVLKFNRVCLSRGGASVTTSASILLSFDLSLSLRVHTFTSLLFQSAIIIIIIIFSMRFFYLKREKNHLALSKKQ